ncbi:uncharacterized protein LOC130447264 [Diorhabda sublineata]|uniref:uncharacterized protein LOC130447264 n=1 Tax=Diorhabda sublineata TaxID=1163346 RepID=UPI0024E14D1A|nr:uncharacterized protein LOC130447264 [Diorhabda sublineata]
MGLIDDELSEVRKLCEHVVPGTKLVSCVRTMVRAEIKRTDYKKLVVCIQFREDYPKTLLLLELKSKTLSEKLLLKLTDVCEQEIKKYLGKPQVLNTIKFLRNFLDENPLSCCYDEISNIRKLFQADELKLKQKSSTVVFNLKNGEYYLTCRIFVPDNYYLSAVELQQVNTNFSPALQRYIISQAQEIARKCVEPPLKKKPREPEFKPVPSLQKCVEFLVDCIKRLPGERCQFCNKICFPSDPKLLENDENSPKHIERIYCGHLFHQECFFNYMKQPPFGNKHCGICGKKIYHFKWSLSDKLAEERWAHEQARERELQEVVDFFE